ncbi:MAG: hypothetical protein PGMFKBFP_02677 [Anaerolineales bacterium]|nr:hypothetical protein [Anaerolineales bacterium]
MTVFQRVEETGGVAHVLGVGEALRPCDGVEHVARPAEVVEVEIAVAEMFDCSVASAHGDFLARGGDAFFHEVGRDSDAVLFDARAIGEEHFARARVVDDDARLVHDAERGVVNGFDGLGI